MMSVFEPRLLLIAIRLSTDFGLITGALTPQFFERGCGQQVQD